MEWGEAPEVTALRELEEETGLTATLGPVLGIFSRWYTAEESALGGTGHSVGVVYEATAATGELTDVMGPMSRSSRSRSWMECSRSTPLPAFSASARHADAYRPPVGSTWSSRNIALMTRPTRSVSSRIQCTRLKAGDRRRTRPT